MRTLAPKARDRLVAAIADRFDADVRLGDLSVSLLPVPHVDGKELSIRHRGWTSGKPLIFIARFTASASVEDLLYQRDNVGLLRLEGLRIDIPPHGDRSRAQPGTPHAQYASANQVPTDTSRLRIVIHTLIADGAILQIEPKTPDRDPLRFDIEKLTMQRVGPGQPMAFQARLQNAKPPGLIETTGRFGPWQKDAPRSTAVDGSYDFSSADLGVFKGITGTLASSGRYSGVLERIVVDGRTDTPNFALARGGTPVHLVTGFHSIVDGTDGDTVLDPVEAHFLNSTFICRGGVVKEHPNEGKTVDLNAVTRDARMEDILQLVLGDARPVISGNVDFRSRIVIPPGDQEVIKKLGLRGQFKIDSAIFASPKAEERLETLSLRARGIGRKEQERLPPGAVASDFFGRFALADGIASFSQLTFAIPGARIGLAGSYTLPSGRIDFKGKFRMQATLSDTQDGVKRWLLKPVDPFFKKDGAGFEAPLTVSGTRAKPEIGIAAFHRHFTVK